MKLRKQEIKFKENMLGISKHVYLQSKQEKRKAPINQTG